MSAGGAFNYRPEPNAIKEKLKVIIALDKENDTLFDFKVMYEEDLKLLKKVISNSENNVTSEAEKLQLYKGITVKYHPYISKLVMDYMCILR